MDYDYTTDYNAGAGFVFALLAFYGVVIAVSIVLGVIVYVLSALAFSRLFAKVGIEGWIAWVPVYNTYKWLELGGHAGWLAFLAFIPYGSIATAVFLIIGSYRTGRAFGKGAEWAVLAFFLSPVWAYLLSRPTEVYRPETFAQFGWPPPLAGFGSVPRATYVPPAA